MASVTARGAHAAQPMRRATRPRAAVTTHRAPPRRGTFTRLRAVLAGALVLGIGTTMTLAAWTDQEFATGSFQTSIFNTESSTVADVWASNTTAPGATLAFSATSMSPTVSFYAWINIRTTSASTVGGTITLADSATTGDLVPVLEYRAVRTAATTTTCDSTAFSGSPTYIAGGSSTYLAVTGVPASAVESSITSPSGELRFCFEVRVQSGAANTYQGKTGSVTWQFAAVSSS